MKSKESTEGFFLAIVSLFFIKESWSLHNNKSWVLSPALFPLIITCLTLLFSIILIIKGLNKVVEGKERGNIRLMLVVVALSFLYFISLGRLHFVTSTIIYLASLIFALGERRWWMIGAISIISPLGIQYIFGQLLGVVLP